MIHATAGEIQVEVGEGRTVSIQPCEGDTLGIIFENGKIQTAFALSAEAARILGVLIDRHFQELNEYPPLGRALVYERKVKS